MDNVRTRYTRLFGSGEGTERIAFFSDAVFAIAMTLLVLDIRLPDVEKDSDLLGAILDLWPQYLAYGLSFAIIARNWISHHSKFLVITAWNSRLITVNLLLLFVVAFVPFPTSLLAEYGSETPVVVLYAATVAALSLLQMALWATAQHGRLFADSVDRGIYRYVLLNLAPLPLVFGLSIVVAVFDPLWAMFSWFLIMPVSVIFGRLARRTR